MNEPAQQRYTLRKHEAAQSLGVSERTIHDLLKSGEIPSFKMGRVVLIPIEGIIAYIADRSRREGRRDADESI